MTLGMEKQLSIQSFPVVKRAEAHPLSKLESKKCQAVSCVHLPYAEVRCAILIDKYYVEIT
jgi:hypothetical protein